MLRELTRKQKESIRCKVDISLKYEDTPGVHDRYNKLKALLEEHGVSVSITKGKGVWVDSCLVFSGSGDISLAEADYINSQDSSYLLPITVVYLGERGFWLHQIDR